MRKSLTIVMLIITLAMPSIAEEVLSKGEAVALISAADFVKKKIGDLFSWTIGYDISRVNRVKLIPSITFIKASPKVLPPDGRTVLEVSAAVEDPEGLLNISGVRADLSSIGKLQNSILVDNGLWGDKIPGDGIYTLQSNVDPAVPLGSKEIPVAAANKKGWVALSKTSVVVEVGIQITDASAMPSKIKADSQTGLAISAEVSVSGKSDTVDIVYANLKELGQGEQVALKYIGGKTYSLETIVPAIVTPGQKKVSIYAISKMRDISQADLSLEVIK